MKKLMLSLFAAAAFTSAAFADEITLMNFAQPQEKAILDSVVARYEATHPGTKVKFISVTGDEYNSKIQSLLAANTLPDVFYMGPENVRKYVDNGKVLDLAPYVRKAQGVDFSDLYPGSVSAYRYDGKILGQGDAIWALPKDFGPMAFGYNKTLFEKYGIPLPSKTKPYTWEEFMDVCAKLTKDVDGNGEADTFGTGLNIRWAFIQFVWGNGTDFLDGTKSKVNITDPKFIEALQFFADMTLGTKDRKPVTPSATQAQSLDTYQRWLKGELGFFPVGTWDVATFNNTLKFEYDLIPWPVHKEGDKTATYRGGIGWAVAANTRNPAKAAELALYLSADKEANKMFCDQDLQIPNLMSLKESYTSKGSPANRQEFVNIISETGRPWPFDYTYETTWFDQFFVGVQDVLDGKITAETYCKTVQPKLQKLLDKSLAKARQSQAKKNAKK